jgi:hypothetical protein
MDLFSGIWDWLVRFWESLTWGDIVWTIVFSIATIIVSYVLIVVGMIKIPADYFSSTYVREINHDKHFSLRWATFIVKNVIGFLLIIAGTVMIFTPGPGVPTILLGLIMMDIPGKRPLEARIIKRPEILETVNNLRARYNKPPLVMD